MLKSLVDKIQLRCGREPHVWGCNCCMTRKDKPSLRRELRRKLKNMLQREVKKQSSRDSDAAV